MRVVFTEGNDAAESGGWDVGETVRVSGEQRVVDSRGGRQRNPLPPPALGDPGENRSGHFPIKLWLPKSSLMQIQCWIWCHEPLYWKEWKNGFKFCRWRCRGFWDLRGGWAGWRGRSSWCRRPWGRSPARWERFVRRQPTLFTRCLGRATSWCLWKSRACWRPRMGPSRSERGESDWAAQISTHSKSSASETNNYLLTSMSYCPIYNIPLQNKHKILSFIV